MSWTLEWPKNREVQSYGRNGGAMQAGLVLRIYDWDENHRLILKPITSKGQESGACHLEIPMGEVPDLIRTLHEIQAHYEQVMAAKAEGVAP